MSRCGTNEWAKQKQAIKTTQFSSWLWFHASINVEHAKLIWLERWNSAIISDELLFIVDRVFFSLFLSLGLTQKLHFVDATFVYFCHNQ